MPEIKPFRAFRYDAASAKNMAELICPPYDVISQQQQQHLVKKNPLNIVRVELPLAGEDQNKYGSAAAIYNEWIMDGVLVQDKLPAVYIYEQIFSVNNKKYCRRGFFAAVKLEKPRQGLILPHENTLSKHKEDRLKLLKEVKANISPIFSFFSDSKNHIRPIAAQIAGGKPLYNVTDDEGITHHLFPLSDPKHVDIIKESILKEKVFIADGHHRYETAWNYLMHMKELNQECESTNYVLMFLCPLEDEGLIVLPTHRVVTKTDSVNISSIEQKAKKDFTIQTLDSLQKLMAVMDKSESRNMIGVSSGKKYILLTLNNFTKIDNLHDGKSLAYRRLGVTVLHSLLLSEIDPHDISFLKNISDASAKAQSGDHIAFLLKSPTLDDIRTISLSGETMPQKTTYFYPKLATGFVIHSVERQSA